jgi:uncharacterized membrane protein YkvA (DUF1232 family)
MSIWEIALVVGAAFAALYLLFVLVLVAIGRRGAARALAGFIPDCVVLFQRLVRDQQVPAGSKLLVGALVVYLLVPFDLVPDFIPVAGQLDDAVLVMLVLRRLLRTTDRAVIRAHWPGPQRSLDLLLRAARLDPEPPEL